jgi:hypothetical protein
VGNSLPTREISDSLLDHFIFNNNKYSISHSTVGVDFSDHSAVFSSINNKVVKTKYACRERTIFNFSKINTDLVSFYESVSETDNPNTLYDSFFDFFLIL